jgi:hypothetical protein
VPPRATTPPPAAQIEAIEAPVGAEGFRGAAGAAGEIPQRHVPPPTAHQIDAVQGSSARISTPAPTPCRSLATFTMNEEP